MAIPCFKQKRFWKAYSHFLFAPNDQNTGLLQLADALAQKLPEDRPLKVLCLGVGVGVFEYSILAAIRARCAFPLEVHGIDLASETLPIAEAVLQNLELTRFPSSVDFAEFVAKHWTEQKSEHPHMRCLDLDGRRSQLESELASTHSGANPWEADFPSLFYERIQDITPADGFDIITACNCLSHMHWWRPALCNALGMLREGGLLLYSRVDGDVNYLDWDQQPERWLLDERAHGNAGTLIHDMMRRFFHGLPPLRSELLLRAQSRAINPWEMLDLLERLPLKDLDTHRRFEYFTRNRMSPQDVYDIMHTCGISPFRRAKDVLEKAQHRVKYNYEVEAGRLLSAFSGREPEITRNRIRWHCYQAPSRERLSNSSLFRRFATSLRCESNAVESDNSSVAEYELLEASIVAHNSFKSPTVEIEHFSHFSRDLLLSGTLRQTTSFGVVGPRLIRQGALRTAICFLNPLHPNHSLNDLISNICLRQIRDYSNSGILLKYVVPAFNVPVVFSYVKSECAHSKQSSIDMRFVRYRSFLEICFTVTLPLSFRSDIVKSQAFIDSKGLIDTSINFYFQNQDNQRRMRPGSRSRPSFVLEVPTILEDQLKSFASAADGISKCFEHYNFTGAFEALTRSWQNNDFFGTDSRTDWAKVFSKEMAEAIYWQALIPKWKKSVIYPATYADPKSHGVKADDFLILFYDENLSHGDVRHEYRKVTLMFDRLNMRRLATSSEASGVEETLAAFSHELSHQTRVLFTNRLRKVSDIFEVNQFPRTNDEGNPNDWPESAGKITVDPSLVSEIKDWLVCPSPKLINSIRDYLMLWAGSPGSLSTLIPNLTCLTQLIRFAVEMAQGTIVAKKMKDISPRGIPAIRIAETDIHSLKGMFPEVTITGDEFAVDSISLATEKGEVVVDLFLRAMAAAISNAFHHAPSITDRVQISLKEQHDGVLFAVRNPMRSASNAIPRSDGSAAVIRSCLRRIDKDTSDPICGKDAKNPELWLTRFLLPFKVSYRDEIIEWRKH
jgi:SAM-dependent methyltransferase